MLKTLCDLNGTSGNEAAVRDYILEQIRPYCTTCTVDAMGSVIAFKKGKRTPEKRVMLSAHMDEVGFIITGATEEGYLQFAPVGGINPSVVLGRRLALENGGYGMVGTVPIHLLHEDAGEKVPSFDELLIDVGAADKQTAEAIAPVGSFAYFSESYVAFGDGKICAKALDDRIGCMLMIELLQSELEHHGRGTCFLDFQAGEGIPGSASKCRKKWACGALPVPAVGFSRIVFWCWKPQLQRTWTA